MTDAAPVSVAPAVSDVAVMSDVMSDAASHRTASEEVILSASVLDGLTNRSDVVTLSDSVTD